jgi:hypothetical protein
MWAALRRHPFGVEAHFRWSLVLAYAAPRSAIEPLVPDGLVLDAHGDDGILAIALVQTEALRPKGMPRFMGREGERPQMKSVLIEERRRTRGGGFWWRATLR